MSTATAHVKRPFVGGGALKAQNRVKEELESGRQLIHQPATPPSFHSMTTGTAHAKVPFVGGGAFKDRDLANRALESERRLRELMGMLLEDVLPCPLEKEEVSSTQELEADGDDE